jgi:NADPH:quinone reductase
MRAVIADPSAPGHLSFTEADPPLPQRSEAMVRVAAISLNRGEVHRAMAAERGWRPGWDLAGTLETAAADGSGPPAGARVVGMLPHGAWTEQVTVPTRSLAELPAEVSFAQAATLPVAGLTALHALRKRGNVLGQKVLITGASGGVGHLALQLARQAGAHVVGLVHQERHAAAARQAGAHVVLAGDDGQAAAAEAPYDLILDSVGGVTLGQLLSFLRPEGTCVSFGSSAGPETTFDLRHFFVTGGLTLYGLILFHELERDPAARGLAQLAQLIAQGRLRPEISVERPWTEIAAVAQDLLDRRFTGKAVLHVP